MKLETWDELDEDDNPIFCATCGKQIQTVDEISQRVCNSCKNIKQPAKNDNMFYCWACGTPLHGMKEIAQGICQNCRASILRKLKE